MKESYHSSVWLSSVCYNQSSKLHVDFCTMPCYPVGMKLKNLNHFNTKNKNPHQLSLAGGMSYPTVAKYLNGNVQEPSALQIAKLLGAMGAEWQSVTLGEILEATPAASPTEG